MLNPTENYRRKISVQARYRKHTFIVMSYIFVYGYFCSYHLFAKTYSAVETENNNIESVRMITMEQFPYGYRTEAGKPIGIWYEILNKIIIEGGLSIKNEIIPTKRLIRFINSNNKMCTLLADRAIRPDNLEVLGEIGHELSAGILPKKGIRIEKYEDLRNIVIAVPLGIEFNNHFDKDLHIQKIRPPQYFNAIKMLYKGRVDAVAGAIPILKYIARTEGISESEFDRPFVFLTTDVYLMCTFSVKKTIRDKLQKTLNELKEKGEIKKIIGSYFTIESKRT